MAVCLQAGVERDVRKLSKCIYKSFFPAPSIQWLIISWDSNVHGGSGDLRQGFKSWNSLYGEKRSCENEVKGPSWNPRTPRVLSWDCRGIGLLQLPWVMFNPGEKELDWRTARFTRGSHCHLQGPKRIVGHITRAGSQGPGKITFYGSWNSHNTCAFFESYTYHHTQLVTVCDYIMQRLLAISNPLWGKKDVNNNREITEYVSSSFPLLMLTSKSIEKRRVLIVYLLIHGGNFFQKVSSSSSEHIYLKPIIGKGQWDCNNWFRFLIIYP